MNILEFREINSTNTYSKENIEVLPDKTIVSAEAQTAGYGRFTRVWADVGSDNIYMSFVLKPSKTLKPEHASLTQYLSVCLAQELETFGLVPKIKWPNDVLLSGKKVCGILAETVIQGGVLKGIVLGIGINLNSRHAELKKIDRPATALNLEIGQPVDKKNFMERLLKRFFQNYDNFLSSGFKFIKDDYISRSLFLGEEVRISIFNTFKEGVLLGFSDDGTLYLKTASGFIENINMGEFI